MNARQQWFLPPDKPLAKRFEPTFFKDIPKCPGVYFMRDTNDKVLYVGQSKNLHQRLLSYKNAHPNHSPRRTLRLVNETRSITWEIHETANAAILREDELLRTLKPRFNRANVYPEGYNYLRVKTQRKSLTIEESVTPSNHHLTFGAFKGTHRMTLGALARMMYRIETQKAQWWQIPWHWNQTVRTLAIAIDPPNRARKRPYNDDDILAYLAGESRALVDQLLEASTTLKHMEEFDESWLLQDLLLIESFFIVGPQRNRSLASMMKRSSPLIESTELNALLIKARALDRRGTG